MSFFLRSAPYLTERIRDVDPLTHTRIYVVPSTLKAGVVRHLTWGILGKTNIYNEKNWTIWLTVLKQLQYPALFRLISNNDIDHINNIAEN